MIFKPGQQVICIKSFGELTDLHGNKLAKTPSENEIYTIYLIYQVGNYVGLIFKDYSINYSFNSHNFMPLDFDIKSEELLEKSLYKSLILK